MVIVVGRLWNILCVLIFLQLLNGVSTTNATVYSDSCFKDRSSVFPCSSTITGNLILMIFYGIVLGMAAKFISSGAEMLLDLGFSPSIVGGVVLPILGAIPDCAIIVASGIGSDAQEKLAIGMGTLAGSTVMLLTVSWSASLVVARCELGPDGVSIDRKSIGFSLTKQGITPQPELRAGIFIMLVTSLFYFVVQTSDWVFGATLKGNQPAYVRDSALATMILCILGLIAYTVYSIFDSKRLERMMKLRKEDIAKRRVLQALIVLSNKKSFKSPEARKRLEDVEDGALSPEEEEEAISKKYFKAWHVSKGLKSARKKESGDEGEEKELLESNRSSISESDDDEDKEDSKTKMSVKCASMLIGGVALVTIFSDPMCDVLSALTNSSNKSYIPIGSFYVSFVITPFCSNASEFVSSLIFASKKTKESATMTYSQLFGAATMNNTMSLAVFMGLVYFKDLEWYYGAEVLCIIVCEWLVAAASLSRKTYLVWMAIPVGATYVFCLVLVYVLETYAHWN